MRTSTQLKAQIRNLSAAKGVQAEVILRSFMLERFLERVSLSPYRKHFVLKGGVLISAMLGIDARTTMDLDATVRGRSVTEVGITDMVEQILRVRLEDGVTLTFRKIEEIRDEADYPGFRVSIDALLDKTRQTMHVDITTGDPVTPGEIDYRFKLMFENRTIDILAYNLETVLAEKFETIISRGVTNTRMRDFYDIHVLMASQQFDPSVFRSALASTSGKRNSTKQIDQAETVISSISEDHTLATFWARYQTKYGYAANVSWELALASLRRLSSMISPRSPRTPV